MTKIQSEKLPEALPTRASPFLELIKEVQQAKDWNDDEMEHHLGLKKAGIMTLIREGILLPSYRSALNLDSYFDANYVELLQVFIRGQATSIEQAIVDMHVHMRENNVDGRIAQAYGAVLSGDKRVCAVKLPMATVLVVPDAAMKPESEDGETD